MMMRMAAGLLLALLMAATLLAFLMPAVNQAGGGERPGPDFDSDFASSSSSSRGGSLLRLRFHRQRGGQRPHRIAIVIPFVTAQSAETFPSYLPTFCLGAGLARDVADFLIFHNDGDGEAFDASLRDLCPSNVVFISLGSTLQFAEVLLKVVLDFKQQQQQQQEKQKEEVTVEEPSSELPRLAFDNHEQLVQVVARHMQVHPYSLVEYKPAYGYIFQEYLKEYSHWGYSDVDMLFGDLGRWVEDDEFANYDIVTYGYGDQSRAYLRGQFTFHRNHPRINLLWRDCDYLSNLDTRLADAFRGKAQYKFESAEGCYSAAVLNRTDLRIKYAVKAWTDVNDHHDSAGTHGLYVSRNVDRGRGVIYKAALATAAGNGTEESTTGLALVALKSKWFETDRVYRNRKQPLQVPVGEFKRVALPKSTRDSDNYGNANCMFWVQKKYQRTLCLSDAVASTENLYWLYGKLYRRAFENVPLEAGVQTGPFFHFQEWKRYYRPSQLAPLHLGSRVPSFVLTKEGAIPLPDPLDVEARRSLRRLAPSPLQASLKHWASTAAAVAASAAADFDERSLLPRRSYCVVSGPRKFPPKPPASECYAKVSWHDAEGIEILSRAPGWSPFTVEAERDVTLVLTLQVTRVQGKNRQALSDIVDVLVENLKRWRGRPSVVVIHVAGGTEEGIAYLRRRFDPRQNQPHFDAALVVVLYQEEDDVLSRKALTNMAIDAVPTRWYVSGLELERGLVLSADAVVLTHRAAQANRQAQGRVFIIPQFAHESSDEGSTTRLNLGDLNREREEGNVKDPSEAEESCASDSAGRLDKASVLWWTQVQELLSPEGRKVDFSTRMQEVIEMEMSLVEYLTGQHHLKMFALDESPILLTDNVGPYNGIRTDEVAREIEELGGRRCYNGLRLAQLGALGYTLDVLGGAYAVSTSGSRRASSFGVDDSVAGASRCDGCFMFAEQHEDILEDIITDEIRRAGKAAVLWAEKYENAKWTVNEE